MSSISTHILDTSLGKPAVGVPVTLEQQLDDQWHKLSSHSTDTDGRVKQLSAIPLVLGVYRISFTTRSYFEAQNVSGLYPLVQITLIVGASDEHYHIPLLLTANGYSTYRGS